MLVPTVPMGMVTHTVATMAAMPAMAMVTHTEGLAATDMATHTNFFSLRRG